MHCVETVETLAVVHEPLHARETVLLFICLLLVEHLGSVLHNANNILVVQDILTNLTDLSVLTHLAPVRCSKLISILCVGKNVDDVHIQVDDHFYHGTVEVVACVVDQCLDVLEHGVSHLLNLWVINLLSITRNTVHHRKEAINQFLPQL